jgi:hypothetical protein
MALTLLAANDLGRVLRVQAEPLRGSDLSHCRGHRIGGRLSETADVRRTAHNPPRATLALHKDGPAVRRPATRSLGITGAALALHIDGPAPRWPAMRSLGITRGAQTSKPSARLAIARANAPICRRNLRVVPMRLLRRAFPRVDCRSSPVRSAFDAAPIFGHTFDYDNSASRGGQVSPL